MNTLPLTESQLFELFAQQHNWQERYRQIIQLSKQLPTLSADQKSDNLLVKGCENRVWLGFNRETDNRLSFYGDSDGRIVKGLLVILLILINNKSAAQIQQINFNDTFKQLHITEELSQSRQIGLQRLVERVQLIANNNQ